MGLGEKLVTEINWAKEMGLGCDMGQGREMHLGRKWFAGETVWGGKGFLQEDDFGEGDGMKKG